MLNATFNERDLYYVRQLYIARKDIDRYISNQSIPQILTLIDYGGEYSVAGYTGTKFAGIRSGLLILKPNLIDNIFAVLYADKSSNYCIDYVRVIKGNAVIINSRRNVPLDELIPEYEAAYDDYVVNSQKGYIMCGGVLIERFI